MIYKQKIIVLIPFPFSDLEGNKKRPALIISDEKSYNVTNRLICMMISSVKKQNEYDIEIKNWKESGLLKPSVARINRLFTIDNKLVLHPLGKLGVEDYDRIISKLLETIT